MHLQAHVHVHAGILIHGRCTQLNARLTLDKWAAKHITPFNHSSKFNPIPPSHNITSTTVINSSCYKQFNHSSEIQPIPPSLQSIHEALVSLHRFSLLLLPPGFCSRVHCHVRAAVLLSREDGFPSLHLRFLHVLCLPVCGKQCRDSAGCHKTQLQYKINVNIMNTIKSVSISSAISNQERYVLSETVLQTTILVVDLWTLSTLTFLRHSYWYE